jgi:hypothetical protein
MITRDDIFELKGFVDIFIYDVVVDFDIFGAL